MMREDYDFFDPKNMVARFIRRKIKHVETISQKNKVLYKGISL